MFLLFANAIGCYQMLSANIIIINPIQAPQLEKTHDTPPSSRDEGLVSCLAWLAKSSPLSRLHRRLDSL